MQADCGPNDPLYLYIFSNFYPVRLFQKFNFDAFARAQKIENKSIFERIYQLFTKSFMLEK